MKISVITAVYNRVATIGDALDKGIARVTGDVFGLMYSDDLYAVDYDAILRYFGRDGIRPAYIPRVLVKMRVGGESNRPIARDLRRSWEDHLGLRRNKFGCLGARARRDRDGLSKRRKSRLYGAVIRG